MSEDELNEEQDAPDVNDGDNDDDHGEENDDDDDDDDDNDELIDSDFEDTPSVSE